MSYPEDHRTHDMGVGDGASTPRAVDVQGLAVGGRGVARPGGVVWFVAGGLPGDRVLVEPLRRHPSYVEGRVVELLRPSPSRRQPACPLQQRCGGCPWMALEEAEQRTWRRRLVLDALSRIAGLPGVPVDETRPASRTFAYRNKVELTLGQDGSGRPAIGFHSSAGPGSIVDVDRCLIQTEPANAILATARPILLEETGLFRAGRDEPLRLVIRASGSTGRVLVALRETQRRFPRPLVRGLADRLAERHAELQGVVVLRGQPGRRGGVRTIPVAGRPWIEERIAGTRFRLPAASFLQVHVEMTEKLVELIVELADPEPGTTRALDLYGGVGVHGLALARRGARVVVCDADPDALACGERAARQWERAEIEFRRAEASSFFAADPRPGPFDTIVANPPRGGLGPRVARAIALHRPRRLVLVSCDPPTMARDVKRLVAHGYVPERVVPVDLFPQTAHVETVCRLTHEDRLAG